MRSPWNLSTLTLATTDHQSQKSTKSKRNKLRRRRRPPPLESMPTAAANGITTPEDDDGAASMPTPMSAAASSSPTLLEKHIPSSPTHRERDIDKDDAQAQVIESLRAQIGDLITQVSQLNGKLVKSYDRVSDLEDDLHMASATTRTQSLKISELEIERAQHLSALNTGLYVEKAHVTSELTRLMERATAEAAARGQAETARQTIEHELDDLSASLFDQANTMVVEARLARAVSERKVVDAEMALHGAEEAVASMQLQMQNLREERDRTSDEIARLRTLMEKGKFVERPPLLASVTVKLSNQHTPYQEFILFISHLRTLRQTTSSPPQVSTLLPLPFLARIQVEDSEPTLRLDFAPSLNWLSRRSVLSAIHSGQLSVEPMPIATFLAESGTSIQSLIPGSTSPLSCALCGMHIFPAKALEGTHQPPPSHPFTLARNASGNLWSSFKNPLTSAAPSPPLTPPPLPRESVPPSPANSTIVHVFRVAHQQAQSHPSGNAMGQMQRPVNYPLCTSGWCLARLRATCSLWAFVRAGIIDRVWEENVKNGHPPLNIKAAASQSSVSVYSTGSSVNNSSWTHVPDSTASPANPGSPPVPPRRRSKITSVGALWGMASGALRNAGSPGSPLQTSEKANEDSPVTPPRLTLGSTTKSRGPPEPLKVTVPPPLPRRSQGRPPSTKEESKESNEAPWKSESSPVGTARSDPTVSEKTPTAAALELMNEIRTIEQPRPERISATNSQSSAQSGSIASEGFKTPLEGTPGLESMSFSFSETSQRKAKTPTPPLSPRSPSRSRAGAATPPLSPKSPKPKRFSSTPPPTSPRTVPLPESRPTSPSPSTPSNNRHRPNSSSIGSMASLSMNANKPPSRPPTPSQLSSPNGPPPPLPRRAAARRAAPAPPFSTESVSAVPATLPPPPSSTESQEEALVETPKSELGVPRPTGRRVLGPRPLSPSLSHQRANTSSPSSTDGNAEKSGETSERLEDTQRREKIETKGDEKTSKSDEGAESLGVPQEPPLQTEEGIVTPISEVKTEVIAATPINEIKAEKTPVTSLVAERKDEKPISHEKYDETERFIVSDATWEERTWKEIVHLREDMFWARAGGIRS